jgi:hypothetical protein
VVGSSEVDVILKCYAPKQCEERRIRIGSEVGRARPESFSGGQGCVSNSLVGEPARPTTDY